MRLIQQKHRQGCVVACLAMIMDISYDQALKLLQLQSQKGARIAPGNLQKLAQVLQQHKFITNPIFLNTFVSSWPTTPFPVVFGIRNDTNSVGHCVIWNPSTQSVFDPNYASPQKLTKYQALAYPAGCEIIQIN